MSAPEKPSTYPFTLRLSWAERALLEERAGELPIGTYMKTLIFSDGHLPSHRGQRSPVKDRRQLAELLACLGAQRLGESLNRLADAADRGSLYVDDKVRHQLRDACHDVEVMRHLLMKALGVAGSTTTTGKQSTSQSFARASAPRREMRPGYE